jgi:hypothetical protein
MGFGHASVATIFEEVKTAKHVNCKWTQDCRKNPSKCISSEKALSGCENAAIRGRESQVFRSGILVNQQSATQRGTYIHGRHYGSSEAWQPGGAIYVPEVHDIYMALRQYSRHLRCDL